MEILSMVWAGFLTGFRYVGIAAGFITGAYAAFLLAIWTCGALNKLNERMEGQK